MLDSGEFHRLGIARKQLPEVIVAPDSVSPMAHIQLRFRHWVIGVVSNEFDDQEIRLPEHASQGILELGRFIATATDYARQSYTGVSGSGTVMA